MPPRSYLPLVVCLLTSIGFCGDVRRAAAEQEAEAVYTPLVKVMQVAICGCAEEYPSPVFQAANLLDESELTEYASNGKGTETYVDFDFGRSVMIAGFRHVDRKDPATVDEAELIFSEDSDFREVTARETIDHTNAPGAVTSALFAVPHEARYVRWQPKRLSPEGHACVGGRSVEFFAAETAESTLARDRITLRPVEAVQRGESGLERPLTVFLEHVYAEPVEAMLQIGQLPAIPLKLQFGSQAVTMQLPADEQPQTWSVTLQVDGQAVLDQQVTVAPVRHWQLHFLPHSHVDIGYTHVQTEVEQKQWEYLRQAMQIARDTADYPAGARFKWNSEVLWAVDSYLQQADDAEKAEFVQAVRSGQIHLDGLYGNELTALCRPEELMRLTSCARRIGRQYDLPIDAAMISDVPGYTWGLVPVLAQSGIKYLSIGPNHIHRIGYTLKAWGDRPFYWVSPSGQERLLCWMAGKAYSWFHSSRVDTLSPESQGEPFFAYLDELLKQDYPYDMVQIRYSVGGDNGPPDRNLCEFVRRWNEKYVWPHLAISTTSELMRTFEERYGAQVPEVRGDFTPYWEDGAGSSAQETAMTRNASERLVQAEALWALLAPDQYPEAKFYQAWREAILYDEHTWGAHCSITEPDSPFTLSQWEIKQAFARNANRLSHELLEEAYVAGGLPAPAETAQVEAIDVWNTHSWTRSDLVTLSTDAPLVGYVVQDSDGQTVPSMLTPRGQLAFVAKDVPPLGARRYRLLPGQPEVVGNAKVEGNTLSNGSLHLEIDPETGTIASLRYQGIPVDLVDSAAGGLNQYRYVAGRKPDAPAAATVSKIEVFSDHGPSAALGVYTEGPGMKQMITIFRVIDGIDRLDIINLLNKEKVLQPEGVHLGFPFQVPGGTMRVDIPWAVIRPESDQMAGACKNYLTVGRWVDISNDQYGVTWTTLDAPLLEVGGIHMDVSNPFTADAWVQHLEPTQTFYSYVMNNYWETNYKASQEGMTRFRYAIEPHLQYDQAAAARFAMQCSQPLIARPVDPQAAVPQSRLKVSGDRVVITSLKPSHDGQALMVRLFNVSNEPASTAIEWSDPVPVRVTRSSPREEVGPTVEAPVELPPQGIVTLRADLR